MCEKDSDLESIILFSLFYAFISQSTAKRWEDVREMETTCSKGSVRLKTGDVVVHDQGLTNRFLWGRKHLHAML